MPALWQARPITGWSKISRLTEKTRHSWPISEGFGVLFAGIFQQDVDVDGEALRPRALIVQAMLLVDSPTKPACFAKIADNVCCELLAFEGLEPRLNFAQEVAGDGAAFVFGIVIFRRIFCVDVKRRSFS